MSRDQTRLKRLQHPGFGKELRHLQSSKQTADVELAGIIVAEIDNLRDAKEKLRPHSAEDRLHGSELKEISYLRLYRNGFSSRIYFVITEGILWILALDTNKRATNITEGTEKMLIARLHDVRECVSNAKGR